MARKGSEKDRRIPSQAYWDTRTGNWYELACEGILDGCTDQQIAVRVRANYESNGNCSNYVHSFQFRALRARLREGEPKASDYFQRAVARRMAAFNGMSQELRDRIPTMSTVEIATMMATMATTILAHVPKSE